MLVLVTYDVSTEDDAGKRRLHQVAKQCEKYGQRVQNSVFECLLQPDELMLLKHQLIKIMDENKDTMYHKLNFQQAYHKFLHIFHMSFACYLFLCSVFSFQI